MTMRTSRRTVTFMRPFALRGVDGVQPAGTYDVETDEELLLTVSFPAYRRVQTLIHLQARPGDAVVTRTAAIDPGDLAAALSRDAAP